MEVSSVVYVCGYSDDECAAWYRVDPEVKSQVGEREQIDPVALLSFDDEALGGWAVTANEDIYWAGGSTGRSLNPSKKLMKHSFPHTNPKIWDVVSTSRNIPRCTPVIAPVSDKLYIVAGMEHRLSGDRTKCGEVYDVVREKWGNLDTEFKHFKKCEAHHAVVALKEGKIIFYSMFKPASITSFDLNSDNVEHDEGYPSFALWGDNSDVPLLAKVTSQVRAVFSNNTFYWFTTDLHLYGYDLTLKKWLRSPGLESELGVSSGHQFPPVLVDLYNGKFAVILTEDRGEVTLVLLRVNRSKNSCSLDMSVENVRALSCGASFVPSHAMAVYSGEGEKGDVSEKGDPGVSEKDMDQSYESSRASWKNMSLIKTFLETCIEEVSLNGRLGNSLKADSWNKVKLVLETSYGFIVTQKQMKNFYDYMRGKYQAWLPITKKTGNVYDPVTNTIRMSHFEWDAYIKAHPKAKSLRTSPLPFPDLCTALFEGCTAIDCTTPRPIVPSRPTHVDIDTFDETEGLLGDLNGDSNNTQSSAPKERKNLKKKRKFTSTQLKIDEKMSAALELFIKNNDGPDIEECMEKLDGLGWEEPYYSAAVAIFCEGDSYRRVWMKMPDVDKLASWVGVMRKKMGLL